MPNQLHAPSGTLDGGAFMERRRGAGSQPPGREGALWRMITTG
jgi:hypothetical protein